MKKNIILVFLVSILIHNSASALWYTKLSDSTVRVVYNASYDTTPNWNVNIPSTVYMKFSSDNVYRNYKVIAIAENAFKNCTNIASVSIGANVATIGNSAFQGCSGIRKISYYAKNCTTQLCNGSSSPFYGAVQNNLQQLIIGNNVQSIPPYAFYGCSAINGTLTIPNSVISIGKYAFGNCSAIDTITIGKNVATIDIYAFQGCTSVSMMLYNAKNCTSLLASNNSSPFYGAIQSNLQHLIIGDSTQSIPNCAFNNCTGIVSLTIGKSVTSIGANAFYGCSAINGTLTIPNSVISIGSSAFSNCSAIDSITIGENVATIGTYAFQGCTSVSMLLYNAKNCTTQLAYNNFSPFYGAIQSNLQHLFIGDSVLSIPNYAFYNCSGIESLTIGKSVTTIGAYAFQGCTNISTLLYNAKNCTTQLAYNNSSPFYGSIQSNLQHLIIGDSVQSIPNYAFCNCTGLNGTLILSNNVTSIGVGAFYNCTGLNGSLVLPNSVTSIGVDAFYNCSGFNGSLIIPNSITTIENYVFSGCSGLNGTLTIPDNITAIGNNAFSYCSNIDSLVIGKNVSSIGESAFYGCTGITYMMYNARNCTTQLSAYFEYSNGNYYRGPFYGAVQNHLQRLVIGNNVQIIPSYAFNGCSQLDGVLIIPNCVTSIGSNSFCNCSGIDSLVLGTNLTTVGTYAFHGCVNIRYLNYKAKNCTTQLSYNNTSPFFGAIQNNLKQLLIGSNVQTIPAYAFYECTHLDGIITIPNNVTTVGQYAFYNCSSLDSLVIGTKVSTIGNYAFQGCNSMKYLEYNAINCTTLLAYNSSSPFYGAIQNNLQKLVIGDNVHAIPNYAFNGCNNLQGIVSVSDSVFSIGNYAFRDCSSIGSVVIGTNVSSIGYYAFYNCTGLDGTINIPNNVTSLGYRAFQNCNGIDSLRISENLSTINTGTFSGCSSLKSVTIPNNIITIGNSAFSDCVGLDTVLMGINVSVVNASAFSNCASLTNVQFSSSLHSIGKKAFYNCDNILSIDFDSAQVALGDSVFADCDRLVTANLGVNATSIGNGTFAGCFRLTTVNMGNAVTSIGQNAFRDCIRLVSPKLSNALTTIGSNAFNGCSLITGQLNFPENVTSIGAGAYSGCSGVTSLLLKPQNPPTIFATTFDSININIPVYVPCGRVLNYYVTDYWENFPNILEMEPYQVNLSVNNDAMGSATITSPPSCGNPQAIIAATANEGFHFIHWSDGNTNNPRVVSLNQDTTLVAHFTVNNAYITVHSNDSVKGHVTGSGLYVYNAPVVIMATANEGYHFIHWNDGNTQNPRYIIAKQDTSFIAIFVSNISNITVFNNNPEMGTVSGSGIYYYQNYATLSATPNYGYHFTHWNDGNIDNPRMLFVDRDTSFTASFALNVYAISASSENSSMGSVTGGGNYTYNMQISLNASANYGYHFSQWSDGNTQNPRTVTVTKDSAFTAQFAANTYTLSVSSNDPDMGSAYGAGTFTYNSQTTISASPNYGYHFLQWSDGNTENPRIVTINGNREYVAMFAINFYTITVNSSNPALGSASGGGSYNYNSSITITATPNYGYHFTQWSDGNTQNPRNVTVMQNATYTAQFAINSYAVTVNSNNNNMGVVLGSGSYIYNTPATISATPNYGYHFVQWNDGSTENPRTFIVTQDGVYTAQFDYNTYTLTALSNNYLAGNVTGGGTYNYLTVVSVNAVPNEHYHFVQWSDSITDNPRNITMIKDTMLTAEFAIDQHSVNVLSSNVTMGSVTGGGEYSYGTTIHLTATSNYGYHFVQWSDGSTQNPRTMIVSQDVTITATFDYNQYVADIQSSDTTKGTVSGFGTYPYLTTVSIQAQPVTGYHFTQWSDGATENPRTFTLTQDTLIVAQFSINMHTVVVQSNDPTMGSVTGEGTYPYQTTITVSANAVEHHHFVQWDDGSTSNPRQIQVLTDITLTAIFAEDDKFIINAICSDTTMGHVYGSGEYYAGMQATLTATPNDHYQFEHWTDGVTANPRTVIVLENATYVAVFSAMSYDILAYSSNEMWGTVNGTGSYPYHSTVTLEAIANEGFHFVCWNDGDSSAVRTIQVEGDAVYIAIFAEGVGIEDRPDVTSLKVYPNPAHESVYIEGVEVQEVEVLDMNGKVVLATQNNNVVVVSRLPVGAYLLRIRTEEGILERKIIKK